METFNQNKVFLCKFFINFNWNQCVSVNILICTCTNSIKHFVLVEKKQRELCWIKSVSVQIFHKVLLKEMCFSQFFNMCMEKFYQNTLLWWKKTARTVTWLKVFLLKFFIKFYQNKCVSVSILICARINSTKTLCFDRKKTSRTVLDQKWFCSHFS